MKTKVVVKQKRDTYIDVVKGIAIILVVLGHAIQVNTSNFDMNLYFRIIYSFHMPLFMFLVGYVVWLQKSGISIHTFIKRIRRLVIPFFAWYFLVYFITGIFKQESLLVSLFRLLHSPDAGLWFLWVAFLCYILLYGLHYVASRLHIDIAFPISLVLLAFLIKLIPVEVGGMNFLKWYFLFFVVGYLVARYKEQIKRYFVPLSIIATILFPLLVSQWMRDGNYQFIPSLGKTMSTSLINLIVTMYSIVVPLLGIVITLFLIRFIRSKKVSQALSWVGNYSLDIYVVQSFIFFSIGNVTMSFLQYIPSLVRVLSSWMIVLVLALIISHFFLRKFKITRLILLGL